MLSNLPRSHSYGNRHHSPKIYGGKLHSFYSAPETSSKNQGEIYNNKRCQKFMVVKSSSPEAFKLRQMILP